MALFRVAQTINKIVRAGSRASFILAGVALGSLVVLTVIDVLGRFVLNKPVKGTVELTGFFLLILAFLTIGYITRVQRHISVDVMVSRLRRRSRAIMESFIQLLSLLFFTYMAYQSWRYVVHVWNTQETSGLLRIPMGIFAILMAIGVCWFCLELTIRFVEATRTVNPPKD